MDVIEGGVDKKLMVAGAAAVAIVLIIVIVYFVMSGNAGNVGKGPGGRYIYVERVADSGQTFADPNIIQFDTIKAFDSAGNSLMAGATVTTASVWGDDPQFAAEHALDAESAFTSFATKASADFADQWIKIDLGSDKHIDDIVISNRYRYYPARMIGTRVRVTDSAGNNLWVSNPVTEAKQSYYFHAGL